MGTTEQVIKNYLRNVYDKIGVSERMELALFTIHHRILAEAAAAKPVIAVLMSPSMPSGAVLTDSDWDAVCAALIEHDVPLLYESGTDAMCDAVVTLTCPRFLQDQRVLARPGMSRERLKGILSRQMSDLEKRRRADFVVQTGLGRRHTLQRLGHIVTLMRRRRGRKWPPSRSCR